MPFELAAKKLSSSAVRLILSLADRRTRVGVAAAGAPFHLLLFSLLDTADSLVIVFGTRLRASLAQLVFGAAQAPTQAQLEQIMSYLYSTFDYT